MTNRELADKLDDWTAMESELFAEAARRLRELPDPSPRLGEDQTC